MDFSIHCPYSSKINIDFSFYNRNFPLLVLTWRFKSPWPAAPSVATKAPPRSWCHLAPVMQHTECNIMQRFKKYPWCKDLTGNNSSYSFQINKYQQAPRKFCIWVSPGSNCSGLFWIIPISFSLSSGEFLPHQRSLWRLVIDLLHWDIGDSHHRVLPESDATAKWRDLTDLQTESGWISLNLFKMNLLKTFDFSKSIEVTELWLTMPTGEEYWTMINQAEQWPSCRVGLRLRSFAHCLAGLHPNQWPAAWDQQQRKQQDTNQQWIGSHRFNVLTKGIVGL